MLNELEILCENEDLMPTRAHPTDAGLDLKVKENTFLSLNCRTMAKTGVRVKIPKGYVGLLFARSSLSKRGILLTNGVGVIDSDYRGEIMAPLLYTNMTGNLCMPIHKLEKFERIVQLVIQPIALPQPKLFIGSESDWLDTQRGEGGFGSSGK